MIIVVGVVSLSTVMFGSWRPTMEYTDFAQDYASSKAWAAHADPYADTPTMVRRYIGNHISTWPHPHTNPHPPAQILTARPFDVLSFRIANAVWIFLMAAALIASLWLVLRQLGYSRLSSLTIAVGSLVLPTVRFALKDGEPNALALLLIVIGWIGLERRNERRSGVALGLATALRLFPVLLIIPVLRRGLKKAAAYQVGVAASVTLLSFLLFGHLHGFVRALNQNDRYWRGAGHNISLVAIPFRWLVKNTWFRHTADLTVLATALFIVLLGGCVVAIARTPARMSRDLLWATIPWIILVAPLAWADYLVLALPCVVLMVHRNRAHPGRLTLIALFSTMILLGRPYFMHSVYPVSVQAQLLGLALPTYGLLGLGLLEWLRVTRQQASQEEAQAAAFYPHSVTQRVDR